MNAASLDASGKQDPVGVFDQLSELVTAALDHRVERVLLVADPGVGLPVIAKVWAVCEENGVAS